MRRYVRLYEVVDLSSIEYLDDKKVQDKESGLSLQYQLGKGYSIVGDSTGTAYERLYEDEAPKFKVGDIVVPINTQHSPSLMGKVINVHPLSVFVKVLLAKRSPQLEGAVVVYSNEGLKLYDRGILPKELGDFPKELY